MQESHPGAATSTGFSPVQQHYLERLAEVLQSRRRFELGEAAAGLRPAAVLALFFPKNGELHLIFTMRTTKVMHHKGQISFPGGRRDPGDVSLVDTALRETQEEVGIGREGIVILGPLDDISTRTGFAVTPYVASLAHQPVYRINEFEVDIVIEVPWRHLLDPVVRVDEIRDYGDHRVRGYRYPYEGHEIWGVTARILKAFIDTAHDPAHGLAEILPSQSG